MIFLFFKKKEIWVEENSMEKVESITKIKISNSLLRVWFREE